MHDHNSKFHFKTVKNERLAQLVAQEGLPPLNEPRDTRRKKKMRRLDQAIKSKDIRQLIELEEDF